jgi:hypothetical protein
METVGGWVVARSGCVRLASKAMRLRARLWMQCRLSHPCCTMDSTAASRCMGRRAHLDRGLVGLLMDAEVQQRVDVHQIWLRAATYTVHGMQACEVWLEVTVTSGATSAQAPP